MIRDSRESDVPAAVRVYRQVYPELLTTEAGFRHRLASEPPRARRRSWCVELGGELVGWASAALELYVERDDVGWLAVSVREDARGRGLGAALYERAETHLLAHGARRLLANSRDEPGSRRFATARGFAHTKTQRLSSVDPREVNTSPLETLRRAKEREGFRLVPMSELRARPELVFDLDATTSRDIPLDEPITDFRQDEWEATYWRHPDVSFDGSFIVLHADRAVAFAMIRVDLEGARALHDMTGTRREFRGRGLARLAKLATLAWSAENGITSVVTENDETNAPMLALNVTLGYRPVTSQLAYVRDL